MGSGALPGEVVAYVRDLVARGELVRVENALRIETALHRLPDWTPGATRLVPLARETCGRDVTDLCEVLAVAGRPGLSRGLCEKLSELPGPRLWKAAERALVSKLGVGPEHAVERARSSVDEGLGDVIGVRTPASVFVTQTIARGGPQVGEKGPLTPIVEVVELGPGFADSESDMACPAKAIEPPLSL